MKILKESRLEFTLTGNWQNLKWQLLRITVNRNEKKNNKVSINAVNQFQRLQLEWAASLRDDPVNNKCTYVYACGARSKGAFPTLRPSSLTWKRQEWKTRKWSGDGGRKFTTECHNTHSLEISILSGFKFLV